VTPQPRNPFDAMTAALTQVGRVDRVRRDALQDPLLSHAAAMRLALQAGPMNAAELAAVAVVKPALVQSLLKWDLRVGRVIKSGTRTDTTYALNDEHCADEQRREHEAIALLRRRGYSVRHNVKVTCPPRAGHRSNDEHEQA
jgi:hypothetical protein